MPSANERMYLMSDERKSAEEKKTSPMTEEEFKGVCEWLGKHLEHKALIFCYLSLELCRDFISKVCELNYRSKGVEVPEKMAQLERVVSDSLEFAEPFITEEERKLFGIKKSDAEGGGNEK